MFLNCFSLFISAIHYNLCFANLKPVSCPFARPNLEFPESAGYCQFRRFRLPSQFERRGSRQGRRHSRCFRALRHFQSLHWQRRRWQGQQQLEQWRWTVAFERLGALQRCFPASLCLARSAAACVGAAGASLVRVVSRFSVRVNVRIKMSSPFLFVAQSELKNSADRSS